jgi:tetratricopeptide (TPR) repeat protein
MMGIVRVSLALIIPSVLWGAEQSSAERSNAPGATISAEQAQVASLKREAVDVARELADAYPEDALTYALLGSAYYNTGRSEEATKYLQKCLQLSPNQADAYEILARVAYEKGDLEDSVRLCREALKRGPANPDVVNQLGRALMDLGRTDEAIQTLEQAVRIPDAPSQSYYLLGQANLQASKYAPAKENFLRAIALLPDHTQAFFALYRACLGLGQTEEAQRYREQFVKLETIDRRTLTDRSAQEDSLTGLPQVQATVARTLFGAAQVYQVHQQPAKTAALLRKAAVLDAESPGYRAALEGFYVQRKELTEGVSAFEKLVAEQPGNHLNYFFLGRLRARLDQVAGAEAAYRKVQQLAPQWAEGYRALADLYLRANRNLPEARVLAKRAAELEPSGAHYYLLTVACVKNNDRPGAVEAIKQAVALAPGEKRYRDLLAQITQAP